MRALAFRHVPFEGIGLIASALDGVEIEYADLYLQPAAPPDPAGFDALIFMGGPMSVNDDLPFIHAEIEIIARANARRQPVLGICLGSQLIARALGAQVRRNPVPEIGWFPIHLTSAARQDPLLAELETPLEVFQWHNETFDLPAGATRLAWSEGCSNQAFRVGDLVYGFQFHPEVTPLMIEDWCAQDCNCADLRELASPIDPHRNSAQMRVVSRKLFRQWRALVQKRIAPLLSKVDPLP